MENIAIEAEAVNDTIPDKDPQTLFIKYKSLYPSHGYIADEVKVEFSVRSLKDPYAGVPVRSILSEAFPNDAYDETPFQVMAAEPRKTFLEKVFLLHEKFVNINPGKIKIERLSRHLYDLVKMMHTAVGQQILKDHEFYQTIVEHRKNYIRLGGVNYDTLHHSTLAFIPPAAVADIFRQDYRSMQAAMIYGTSPDFDTMIDQLKLLTGRFRLLTEYQMLEDVIKQAAAKISNDKNFETEGTTCSTPVMYLTDIYKPDGPQNKSIIYTVHFIRKSNQWVFEQIVID
jgi:Nucleotidyl transferase AbiEii toxin, Type IV TA system